MKNEVEKKQSQIKELDPREMLQICGGKVKEKKPSTPNGTVILI